MTMYPGQHLLASIYWALLFEGWEYVAPFIQVYLESSTRQFPHYLNAPKIHTWAWFWCTQRISNWSWFDKGMLIHVALLPLILVYYCKSLYGTNLMLAWSVRKLSCIRRFESPTPWIYKNIQAQACFLLGLAIWWSIQGIFSPCQDFGIVVSLSRLSLKPCF